MITNNLDPACMVVILLDRCLDGTGLATARDIRERFARVHSEVCITCREYQAPTADTR